MDHEGTEDSEGQTDDDEVESFEEDSNFSGSLPEKSDESLRFHSIPSGSSIQSRSVRATPANSPKLVKKGLFPQYTTYSTSENLQQSSNTLQGRDDPLGTFGEHYEIPKLVEQLSQCPQTTEDAEAELRSRQVSFGELSADFGILFEALRYQQSYLAQHQHLYVSNQLLIQEHRRTIAYAYTAIDHFYDDIRNHWCNAAIDNDDPDADASYRSHINGINRKRRSLEEDIKQLRARISDANFELIYYAHELNVVPDIIQRITVRRTFLYETMLRTRADINFLHGYIQHGKQILQQRQSQSANSSAMQCERSAVDTAIRKEDDDITS